MLRSSHCLLVLVLVTAGLLLSSIGPGAGAAGEAPFHPHFKKQLECQVAKGVTVTVRYQTVTFDKDGAGKMKAGESWHLAGAILETTTDLQIGGQDVAAGTYALSARKTAKGFELTLHEGGGFSRPGADAIALTTELDEKAPLFEHMNIDVQPAGDKEHTRVSLDVRFDTLRASALIEVPKD